MRSRFQVRRETLAAVGPWGAPANRCGKGDCQTGDANAVFPGGWDDEQWFGITDAKANGRKDDAPVISANTGKLNGGPDILRPRAAIVAVCEMYDGPAC